MSRRHVLTSSILAAGLLAIAALGGRPVLAQTSLHLALTPSQKPTDLLVAGEAFGTALGIYTFWVLLNNDARREFGWPPRGTSAGAVLPAG